MKFNAKEDIEAPSAFVYAALSDFDGWERAALRRGAEVARCDTPRHEGPGMAWQVGFPFRGKVRQLKVTLARLEPDQRLEFAGEGQALEGGLVVELVELGPKRTRVTVVAELKPRTLPARLFVQSLKFARAKVAKRFSGRVALAAADIEDRYKRSLRA